MSDLSTTVARHFVDSFRSLAARVRELAEPLDEEAFWSKPFPFGNSFGHLTLHLTGNLSYYIGAQIAETGYVRDREREFTETERPSKEEALARLDAAVAVVVAAIEAQSPDDWSAAYTANGVDETDRFGIFLNCATHFRLHVGQMGYIASAAKGEAATSTT
jgi:hypothetical protein